MAGHSANPLGHVIDHPTIELPWFRPPSYELTIIPGGASPTWNVNVTAVLALMTLGIVIAAGMREMGPTGYWIGIVPHLDVPAVMKPPLWILMFFIEVAGLLIRHVVLAVRLF